MDLFCVSIFINQGYPPPDSTTEPNSMASSDATDSSSTVRPMKLPAPTTKHSNSAANSSTTATLNGPSNGLIMAAAATTTTATTTNTSNNNNTKRKLSASSETKPQNPLYTTAGSGSTVKYPINGSGAVVGGSGSHHYESALNRRSPEGKDFDSLYADHHMDKARSSHGSNSIKSGVSGGTTVNNNNSQKMGNDLLSTEIFSALNDNGKINVQVTVLVGEFFFYILIFVLCCRFFFFIHVLLNFFCIMVFMIWVHFFL